MPVLPRIPGHEVRRGPLLDLRTAFSGTDWIAVVDHRRCGRDR